MTKSKWPIVKLGELIEHVKSEKAGQTDYPVLSMTMKDGLVLQDERFKKKIASKDTSAYKVVLRDQLVVGFPIDEGVLDFQTIVDAGIVSPAYKVWRLRGFASVDKSFLANYLRSEFALAYYRTRLRGTTARRRSLTDDAFLSMPVPLPPLEEQKRIAEILSFSDSLIEKSKQAVALLNPNLALSESIVANAESTVPLSTYITGITSGKSLVADNEGESQNKVLKISAVTTGTFLASEVKTLPKDYDPDDSHRVAAGDILVSRANTTELVGASVLVDEVASNIFLPDKLWKLTLVEDVNPVFLWALLQSKTIRSRISRCSTGSSGSMKNISKKNFLSVHVPDFSMELQNKIGNSIQIIREQKKGELRRLSYLQGLHSSLMSVAFEGGL